MLWPNKKPPLNTSNHNINQILNIYSTSIKNPHLLSPFTMITTNIVTRFIFLEKKQCIHEYKAFLL